MNPGGFNHLGDIHGVASLPIFLLKSMTRMKNIILLAAFFSFTTAAGQVVVSPTDTVKIIGRVKRPVTLPLAALDTFRQSSIGDIAMLDGRGDQKETARSVKGILLKDLMAGIEFDVPNRKALNRFYFVFSATDGFKLVLSWNEIMHAETCTNYYLLSERDVKNASQLKERLEILAVTPEKKAHKRIDGLSSISINMAD